MQAAPLSCNKNGLSNRSLVREGSVAMRRLLLLFAAAAMSYAATPTWLDLVAPVITPAEKKAYLALKPEDRPKYEDDFWSGKALTAKEYRERVDYVDSKFGSSRLGSGANTDQGRVYLAL